MIRNKLSVLLAERGLKATKVSNDTGIAKSTLSKITNNSSEKIDYSTINTLCRYLKITPCDFFEYEPFDVSFFVDISNELLFDPNEAPLTYKVEGFLNVLEDFQKTTFEYIGHMIDYGYGNDEQHIIDFYLEPTSKVEADRVSDFLFDLKPSFVNEIKFQFEKEVLATLKNQGYSKIPNDAVSISLDSKK